eukprot:gnl/TRDRNA2_/TRDRNA2_185394_c0_seq1.p1 gnl/TRDRNA2_/TRDRNA2_185394_c0~~gnl/TRDRNA2_/TRDRNA2_185394_c0_seq1.p1  ORF type:complete len:316 (+),score=68.22 gnl/TRDRNA2_/TRDRNA2_185394_c0_seq1:87-1034(+)
MADPESDRQVPSLDGRCSDVVPSGHAAAEDDAELECVICFDDIRSAGGAVQLPCDCKVTYCNLCWDRALAASITACNSALCPSCRTPMRVDYDASEGRLAFSRAPTSPDGGDASEDGWRKRLYEQAKPMQIRLLQEYGRRHQQAIASASDTSDAASVAEAAASSSSDRQTTEGEDRVPAEKADGEGENLQQPEQPRCVCGSRLACVSVRERVFIFISEETPMPPPPSVIRRLMKCPPIVCDLCDRRVDAESNVWTCENGRRTVLHAVAYDVCEACFNLHAFGLESTGDEPHDPDSVDDESSVSDDDDSSEIEDDD